MDHRSNWLAAYVLGMAYARPDAADSVGALVEIASGDADLLLTAAERVVAVETVDADVRSLARSILTRAAGRAELRTSQRIAVPAA
jgi:hypothetical protein